MSLPDRFTCEDYFRRLDDFLDRELTAEEMARLREHLEVCAACAAGYRFESGVLRDLRRKLRQVAMPADLRQRISRLLAEEGDTASGGPGKPS